MILEQLRVTLLSLKLISDRLKSLITNSVTKSEATANKQAILNAIDEIELDTSDLAKDATVAKESAATANKEAIIAAINNIDLSTEILGGVSTLTTGLNEIKDTISYFYKYYNRMGDIICSDNPDDPNADTYMLPDNFSFAELITSDIALKVVEINDKSTEWEMSAQFLNIFPNLRKLTIGAKVLTGGNYEILSNLKKLKHLSAPNLELIDEASFGNVALEQETLIFPKLKRIQNWRFDKNIEILFNATCKTVILPELEYYEMWYGNNRNPFNYTAMLIHCNGMENFIAPKLKGLLDASGYNTWFNAGASYDSLKKIILGTLEKFWFKFGADYYQRDGGLFTKLIHFEIGKDSTGIDSKGINMMHWKPTFALMADTTEDGYVDLTGEFPEESTTAERNAVKCNRDLFLLNFKYYIAERLADRTGLSSLTIAVSDEVRTILTGEIENIIISKNWNITTDNF